MNLTANSFLHNLRTYIYLFIRMRVEDGSRYNILATNAIQRTCIEAVEVFIPWEGGIMATLVLLMFMVVAVLIS